MKGNREDASSMVTAGATADTTEGNSRASRIRVVEFTFTETKKHSPNTGARANNILQATRPPHRGACWAECARSALRHVTHR